MNISGFEDWTKSSQDLFEKGIDNTFRELVHQSSSSYSTNYICMVFVRAKNIMVSKLYSTCRHFQLFPRKLVQW